MINLTPQSALAVAKKISAISSYKMARKDLYDYGSEVIGARAIPDFRDGLKPVQRRAIWTFKIMGYAKTNIDKVPRLSKISGTCQSNFHPHAPAAIEEAIVNMSDSHSEFPLIIGEGNFGDYSLPAGASRYIGATLSSNGLALLNEAYLAVVPYVDNYDKSSKEPLFLPARLPIALLTGASGIAYGCANGIPSFTLESIITVLKQALKDNNSLTDEYLATTLEFFNLYGGTVSSELDVIKEFMRTGRGTLYWYGSSERDEKTKKWMLTSFPPNFRMESFTKKVMTVDCVRSFDNHADMDNPISMVVSFKAGTSSALFKETCNWFDDIIYSHVNYNVNCVELVSGEDTEDGEPTYNFSKENIASYILKWLDYRIDLETKVIQYKINRLTEKIRWNLILQKAATKISEIADLLKKKGLVDLTAGIVNIIDVPLAGTPVCTPEEASRVLSLSLRSLSSMEALKLQKELEEFKKIIISLQLDAKDVKIPIGRDLDELQRSKIYVD